MYIKLSVESVCRKLQNFGLEIYKFTNYTRLQGWTTYLAIFDFRISLILAFFIGVLTSWSRLWVAFDFHTFLEGENWLIKLPNKLQDILNIFMFGVCITEFEINLINFLHITKHFIFQTYLIFDFEDRYIAEFALLNDFESETEWKLEILLFSSILKDYFQKI